MNAGASPITVERVPRSIIEKRLLDSLGEGPCVAILASKGDLALIIAALQTYDTRASDDMAKDLNRLCIEAFGNKT